MLCALLQLWMIACRWSLITFGPSTLSGCGAILQPAPHSQFARASLLNVADLLLEELAMDGERVVFYPYPNLCLDLNIKSLLRCY
ncbi:hypothetical protein FB45DRAFT_949160 [Roridomyces roridus]|uniref:Secreted protein n=1 Tax=Roridomyces roridus TaxID=1738132 RepID=A0AAD7FA70_9AGAR|nr:hypothetical protein FB45DRAFT_949160 [Roridomyces roridus]